MVYRLVALSGRNKGACWLLDEAGLLLGRDPECAIIISDPVVSRRHCRIYAQGDAVQFEDLQSLNPALINGVPARNKTLGLGDEIAIGRWRFILVASCDQGSGGPQQPVSSDTISWNKAEPLFLKVGDTPPGKDLRPRTVTDLVLLYEATRELGACTTISEFMTLLQSRLRAHFKPQALWAALVYDESELAFFGEQSQVPTPKDAIQQALSQSTGVLEVTRDYVCKDDRMGMVMAAPVCVGGVPAAVLALYTEPPHGAYDEEDLRLLVLLSQSLGPLFGGVEHLERLQRDNEHLRSRAGESTALLGDSRVMGHVRSLIAQAARTSMNVLITGETGTGKELAARMVCTLSRRSASPLIIVNCAAIPKDLFESELFGHEKGAFTGAETARDGLMAQAHGGTLFLDEIGDLSMDNQARILRAIEQGTFRRVGGKEEIRVDVRVVSATNRDLREAIRNGAFREDLFQRLNGFEIRIPPLRERPSDIPLLAQHFLEMFRSHAKRPITGFTPDALEHLKSRNWTGNVRQLRNAVQRAVTSSRGTICADDFLAGSLDGDGETTGIHALSLGSIEKNHIAAVLERCGWDVRKAADVLQIGRSTLYKKIAEYQLEQS